VLSALIGLAIVVTLAVRSYQGKRGRLAVLLLLIPLMASLLTLETRTGIAIIGVAGIVTFGLVLWRKTVDTLPIILAAGLVLLATVVAFPSSARTALTQFSRIGSDPSIAGRVVDIAVLPGFVARRPILGAGYMTLNPELVIFDNSYFGGLVELGVIGFGLLLAFLILATVRPLLVLGLASDRDTPILIAGFSAGVSLLVAMATFDATAFAQFYPSALILVAMGLGRTDAITRRARGPSLDPGNASFLREALESRRAPR
jgi:O-antigen ligase